MRLKFIFLKNAKQNFFMRNFSNYCLDTEFPIFSFFLKNSFYDQKLSAPSFQSKNIFNYLNKNMRNLFSFTGCRRRDTDTFMNPGDTFTVGGRTCTCASGTDPNLMDSSTLYHISCQLKLILINETTPTVDETTPLVNETTPPVDETAPAVNETAPPVDETTTPVEVITPPLENTGAATADGATGGAPAGATADGATADVATAATGDATTADASTAAATTK